MVKLLAHNIRPVLVVIGLVMLITAALLTSRQAGAMGFVSISQKPASISSELTPTFVFFGGVSRECKIDDGAFASCTSPFTTPALSSGTHTFTVHIVGEVNSEATASYTWTINLPPSFSGDTSTTSVIDTTVDVSYLQVVDSSADLLTVKLTAPSGVLAMSVIDGLTFSGPHTGTTITFMGLPGDINNGLASLMYTPTSAGSKVIEASLTGADGGTYETFNGHFYNAVKSGGINWDDAKTAAEASTFGGATGYLATITSSDEDAYLQQRIGDGAWFGGSDVAVEGDWKWVGGPEVGDSFWSGDFSGSAVGGAFTNWQFMQPDNFNDEDCSELRLTSSESWNDEDCASLRQYYIIEYGDDVTLPELDTAELTVNVIADGDSDGDGLDNSAEVVSPNKGDANNDGQLDYLQPNVGSQRSSLTNAYVINETSCTANANIQIGAESSLQKDVAYDYPHGLMSFIGTGCGVPGVSVDLTQYYFGDINPTQFVLRKWNPANSNYTTIADAVLGNVTIGGQAALKVVYQVVDGGPFDSDGAADGNISDPVGLGSEVIGVPNTGFGGQLVTSPPLLLIGTILPKIRL